MNIHKLIKARFRMSCGAQAVNEHTDAQTRTRIMHTHGQNVKTHEHTDIYVLAAIIVYIGPIMYILYVGLGIESWEPKGTAIDKKNRNR